MQASVILRISNIQGTVAAIKIYDGGVVSGDLTSSLDRDWEGTGTLQHCEDTVTTVDFWGQIATYLCSVYKWTEEKHLVTDTELGYLKRLFNEAKARFSPAGGHLVGTGQAREFFLDQGAPPDRREVDPALGLLAPKRSWCWRYFNCWRSGRTKSVT